MVRNCILQVFRKINTAKIVYTQQTQHTTEILYTYTHTTHTTPTYTQSTQHAHCTYTLCVPVRFPESEAKQWMRHESSWTPRERPIKIDAAEEVPRTTTPLWLWTMRSVQWAQSARIMPSFDGLNQTRRKLLSNVINPDLVDSHRSDIVLAWGNHCVP